MPGDDGLTMLAGLRSEFPRLQVTVLTGYRDFNYAQSAIRLGVCRYILKPSRMDELREALETMTAALGALPPPEAPPPAKEEEHEAHNFIVRNALRHIEGHYAEKLTLQEVAEKTYVSQWHLSKLLNRHTGQSFIDILQGVRVREATRMLDDPSLRIADISQAVGFADVAHFSRVFKKIAGVSAFEYRNRLS
jgi:YesN/AraC family two-component response regulator